MLEWALTIGCTISLAVVLVATYQQRPWAKRFRRALLTLTALVAIGILYWKSTYVALEVKALAESLATSPGAPLQESARHIKKLLQLTEYLNISLFALVTTCVVTIALGRDESRRNTSETAPV